MWTLSKEAVAILGIISLCLTLSTGVTAQCVDYNDYMHWVGQVEMPDELSQIAIQGNLAFVANRSAGLQVIDLTNPDAPVIVGACDTPDDALQVTVQGQYAYLRTGISGLQVIDISIPHAPEALGFLFSSNNIQSMAVQGDYAYVTGLDSEFMVIDISAPDSLEIVANIDLQFNRGIPPRVLVQGNFAFVLEFSTGLRVVDISNPLEPEVVCLNDIGGKSSFCFGIQGDFIYVSCADDSLIVLDITNPTSPELVGQCELMSYWNYDIPNPFIFNGEYAFFESFALDISDPTSPIVLGSLNRYSGPGAMWEDLYIDGSSDRIQIIDTPSLDQVSHLSSTQTLLGTTRIAVQGDFAYLTSYSMFVMDISPPDTSILVGEIDLPNEANRIDVQNQYAYVTGTDTINGSLQIVEITDPTEPVMVAEMEIPGRSNLVHVQGDFAYVTGNSNIMVVNIADPEDAYISGSIDTWDSIHDIAVQGDFVYVANGNAGIQVIEASSPANPTIVGSVTVSGEAKAVAVQENLVFVIDWNAETSSYLRVIDVSFPNSPQIIGFLGLSSSPSFISVEGNYAYVSGTGDLLVINITNPNMPVIYGNTPCFSGGGGLAIASSGVCLAPVFSIQTGGTVFYGARFEKFPLQCDQTSSVSPPNSEQDSPLLTKQLLDLYPNPFNPSTTITFNIKLAGPVNLSVFDLAGRKVSVLVAENLDVGPHEEHWHGVDTFGRAVSTGQYFIRLKTQQGIETQKVTLIN